MPAEATEDHDNDLETGATPAKRIGRGSLVGRLTLTDDWDAPETNEEIAQDFGLLRIWRPVRDEIAQAIESIPGRGR